MHKTDKGDTVKNRSNKRSNSLVYNNVSDRKYPPLIFHDLSVASPGQQNQEMCHPKVASGSGTIDSSEDKYAPPATSKENTMGVSRARSKPKIQFKQIDRKRPSRFQPILPRTALQANIQNRQQVTNWTTPGNAANRSRTPTVGANMVPQSVSVLNDHNVSLHLLQNSTAVVIDSPVPHTVVSPTCQTLPTRANQQQVLLLTHMDQFRSGQIRLAGAPSNVNCLTGNPFYYYNMKDGQSNIQLSLKGQETINSAVGGCEQAKARVDNRAGPQDILQAADKLNLCRGAHGDPPAATEDRSKDKPCESSKSCILDIAEENVGKVFKPEVKQCRVTPTNPGIETPHENLTSDESHGEEAVILKRMIRPEQIMRPKHKYIQPSSVYESDEDCVDLNDLIKTSADQSGSSIKSYANRYAKRRIEHADILNRFPPTFMQDLFEDVSNSNPESYVDAYATAMAMEDDASSSQ